MKQLAFILFLFSSTASFGQTKKAALVSLSTENKKNYAGGFSDFSLRTRVSDNTFKNGKNFNDTLTFNAFKSKLSEILPKLNFDLMPEDSVLNSPNYQKILKTNSSDKKITETAAKGYAPTQSVNLREEEIKSYFVSLPTSNIIIKASTTFTLRIVNDVKGLNGLLECVTFLTGRDVNGGFVFAFRTNFESTKRIAVQHSGENDYAYDIMEDISQLQMETLEKSLKKMDAKVPEQLIKVNKFYAKQGAQ